MSAARDHILGGIRRRLGKGEPTEAERAALEERVRTRRIGPIPARAQLEPAARVDLFVAMAEKASASVARVATLADVPAAVSSYLASENLPASVVPAPALAEMVPWSAVPTLEVRDGAPERDGDVSVTPAFAGVAETGTLMLTSGAGTPTGLNFVPDTHVVVLHAFQVVGPYEDAWDRLRERGEMPRAVNLVTGPSRTGDIEQRIQIGAHGPRRLHIVLVDDAG